MTATTPDQYEDLIPLGRSLPLRVYLRSLWDRRQFAITVPMGELRAQHMNTVLGNVWHLLNPVLQVGVYFLVFGLLLNTDRGLDNFITYLAIGVFSYGYMQRSITACATSIVRNEGLIRSLSFPRAILPIAAVARESIAFSSSVGLMLVLAVVKREPITLSWLMLLVWIPLMAVFSLGVGFVLARLTDRIHDVRNLLPFLFRIAFYVSGVIYAFERVIPESRAYLLPFLALNPFFTFLSHMRHALMTSYHSPTEIEPWLWLSGVLYPLVFVVGGFVFFRRGEQRYGRG